MTASSSALLLSEKPDRLIEESSEDQGDRIVPDSIDNAAVKRLLNLKGIESPNKRASPAAIARVTEANDEDEDDAEANTSSSEEIDFDLDDNEAVCASVKEIINAD
eukprot:CAMPEP_0116873252 /NCGR_PEP_ID=MMETSP0463-20121206/4272_1 /TAXON_ID=181622 /ORGANISM="Strombidinopsis sp, Strain SopsisLIS2011" /LENGTH=105 /DNA_ID=CAMNT_0004514827 /DNA_START=359 /DNA_END=676 /DNA_ORIENTATION=-